MHIRVCDYARRNAYTKVNFAGYYNAYHMRTHIYACCNARAHSSTGLNLQTNVCLQKGIRIRCICAFMNAVMHTRIRADGEGCNAYAYSRLCML